MGLWEPANTLSPVAVCLEPWTGRSASAPSAAHADGTPGQETTWSQTSGNALLTVDVEGRAAALLCFPLPAAATQIKAKARDAVVVRRVVAGSRSPCE